jgi:DNA-binding transcriptional regulator YiaG
MPNIGVILKSEIQRLAKKEVKAAVTPLHKAIITLRKELSALKKAQKSAAKSAQISAKSVKVAKVDTADEAKTSRVRPTGKTMVALRTKFGMTQGEFGRLLKVGRITIARWENQEGKLNLRQSARDAFAGIQKLGTKAARAQLETLN